MGTPRGNSARTKATILASARELFASQGIHGVSIRDIAADAGVSHGLVQRYWGTREELIAEVVRREVALFGTVDARMPTAASTPEDLEVLRSQIASDMAKLQDFASLITRASLTGFAPETMIDDGIPTVSQTLADAIRATQARIDSPMPRLDPQLVSAYVNASLLAFGAMAPWIMASVGLDPEDYESRIDEIADISVQLIALACGITGRVDAPGPAGA